MYQPRPPPLAPSEGRRRTPTRHQEPRKYWLSFLKHNGSATTKYLDGNLLASRQSTLANLILRTLVINKGTHTPKGPADLQGLDVSTQLHGELLLSAPELLEVHQALGKVLVLLEDFLHPRSLCHEGSLHLPLFITLPSHLKEGLVNVKPIKTFDALTSFSRTSIRLSSRLPIEDVCLISKLVGTPLPLIVIPGSRLEHWS